MQCSDLRMRYCCVFVMFAPRQVYLGVTGRQKRDVIRAAHRAETDQGVWMIIKYDISSLKASTNRFKGDPALFKINSHSKAGLTP